MLERGDNKEYLPMEGLAEFRSATVELLLGKGAAAVKEVSACVGKGLWEGASWHCELDATGV